MICTPFSIAGALYMIYSYFQASTKNFTSKLVFCLALSDMLITLVDLMEIFDPYNQCVGICWSGENLSLSRCNECFALVGSECPHSV